MICYTFLDFCRVLNIFFLSVCEGDIFTLIEMVILCGWVTWCRSWRLWIHLVYYFQCVA